ncbi:MAG: cytochrome c [Pararhodobacter sp.]
MVTKLTLAAAICLALPVMAHAEEQQDPNIKARIALMDLYAYNIGVLGGMAQGRMPYDAELAASAATSLYHLARSGSARMWPEGTDNFSVEGTRALPAIWDNMADFAARAAALRDATETMMNAAGTDLASLQAAIGPLGAACGGCHEAYRQPQ